MDQINTQPVPTTQITPPARSGFLRWILIAGIAVVSISGIIAYTILGRSSSNNSSVVSNYSVSPSTVPVVTGKITKANNLTGENQYQESPITPYPGAKIYTSQKWGIRFQYPMNKRIEITEPDRLSEDGLLNEAIAINVTQASRDALSNTTLFTYHIRTIPNDSSKSFNDNLRSYFANRINFNDCSIITPKQKLIKSLGEERYIAPTTSEGIVNYCGNLGVYGMSQKREIISWRDASTYFVLPSNNSPYIYVIDGGYVIGGLEGELALDSVWQDTIEFLPRLSCNLSFDYIPTDWKKKNEAEKRVFFGSGGSETGCDLFEAPDLKWLYENSTGTYLAITKKPYNVISDDTYKVEKLTIGDKSGYLYVYGGGLRENNNFGYNDGAYTYRFIWPKDTKYLPEIEKIISGTKFK